MRTRFEPGERWRWVGIFAGVFVATNVVLYLLVAALGDEPGDAVRLGVIAIAVVAGSFVADRDLARRRS